MNRKTMKKLLLLNKKTIANLDMNKDDLKLVRGGIDPLSIEPKPCVSECASACFATNCCGFSDGRRCQYK